MNWVSQHIDKQFRLLFDQEIWMVGFAILAILVVAGVNQALGMGIIVVFCFIFQKIVDRNPKGYVIHYLDNVGIINLFQKKTKYRF